MSGYIREVTSFNDSGNIYRFWGNTLIQCPIPDNTMIVIEEGSLVVAGPMGRDVNISTRHGYSVLDRAKNEIANNNYASSQRSDVTLKLGSWARIVKPFDIVFLAPPQKFNAMDKKYRIDDNYLVGTIQSSGDLYFLQGSPDRVTSNVSGSFTCLGSLGALNVVNVMKDASIDRVGDFSSIGCSGNMDVREIAKCVSFSCAGSVTLGHTGVQEIDWGGSTVTCAGGFFVYGKLTHEDGINARLEYKVSDPTHPMRKRMELRPRNFPDLSNLVVR